MNKDKIIKDIKERNDKLQNQYRLRDIRCVHLEYTNEVLQNRINKAIKFIKNEDITKYIKEKLLEILGDIESV